MGKCCVCRKQVTEENPAILFIGKSGDEKNICETCEQKINILVKSDNPKEIKEAINYLYTCSLSVHDSEVSEFLRDTIESNSAVVDELEEKRKNSEPVNIADKQDYFLDRQAEIEVDNGKSFWISGMKVFAWITFCAIIIGGLVLATQVGGGVGFLLFIGSIIMAFLIVAMEMIFLNLAQNVSNMNVEISEIKQMLKKE